MFDHLPSAWIVVSYHLDHALNSPLIKDADDSYACISLVRVLLIGTILLALLRIIGMVRILPKRRADQTWAHYFRNPWWRTPALLMSVGLVGIVIMLALQTLARDTDATVNRLANVTWYLALSYGAFWLVALGLAIMAGEFRARMKGDL